MMATAGRKARENWERCGGLITAPPPLGDGRRLAGPCAPIEPTPYFVGGGQIERHRRLVEPKRGRHSASPGRSDRARSLSRRIGSMRLGLYSTAERIKAPSRSGASSAIVPRSRICRTTDGSRISSATGRSCSAPTMFMRTARQQRQASASRCCPVRSPTTTCAWRELENAPSPAPAVAARSSRHSAVVRCECRDRPCCGDVRSGRTIFTLIAEAVGGCDRRPARRVKNDALLARVSLADRMRCDRSHRLGSPSCGSPVAARLSPATTAIAAH